MGRGSRLEPWAWVAQIKGQECLGPCPDFLWPCPPTGVEMARHSRPLRDLGTAPLLPLLPPNPEQCPLSPSLALLSSPQAQGYSRVPGASGAVGGPGEGLGKQVAQVTGGQSPKSDLHLSTTQD